MKCAAQLAQTFFDLGSLVEHGPHRPLLRDRTSLGRHMNDNSHVYPLWKPPIRQESLQLAKLRHAVKKEA